MLDNVSATSVPYLPAEPRLRLDSDDHLSAVLASISLAFSGGGSSRAALSQLVARMSRDHALVLPTRYRDAALIDPSKPALARACGKLKNSVSCCSVTSMDSLLLRKEPVELPAALKLNNLRMAIEEAHLTGHGFAETHVDSVSLTGQYANQSLSRGILDATGSNCGNDC